MKKSLLFKLLIILFIILSFSFVNAKEIYATSIGDVITGADDFIQSGIDDTNPTIEDEGLQEMSNLLYNILFAVAIVIAVIIGLVIGIQFMTGSVEQKAKIKETLIPYIAGCIVIFGAFGIWKLAVEIFSKI